MTDPTLLIAADHGGFILKSPLITLAQSMGWSVVDLGTENADLRVDYPDFAQKLCEDLLAARAQFGVLLCGTGIGMSIAANRYDGIRAAVCHNIATAQLARAHNNANVLCLGGRVLDIKMAEDCLKAFLESSFEAGRHQIRLDKIAALGGERFKDLPSSA